MPLPQTAGAGVEVTSGVAVPLGVGSGCAFTDPASRTALTSSRLTVGVCVRMILVETGRTKGVRAIAEQLCHQRHARLPEQDGNRWSKPPQGPSS